MKKSVFRSLAQKKHTLTLEREAGKVFNLFFEGKHQVNELGAYRTVFFDAKRRIISMFFHWNREWMLALYIRSKIH